MTQSGSDAGSQPRATLRLAILILTILFVSESARRSLSVTEAPWGHFVVTAVPTTPSPDSTEPGAPGALRVGTLVVDGRRIRLDELESRVGWQVVEMENFQATTLVPLADAASSVLEFDGSHFLLQLQGLPWDGDIRVARDGVELSSTSLSTLDDSLLLEAPPTAPSWWIFGVTLLALGWLTWALGAWRVGGRTAPWLLAMLAAHHLVFWATQAIGVEDDTPGYLESLAALREGVAAYFPPGYPLLLGFAQSLSGERFGLLVTLLQHVMIVAGAIWTYGILRRVVDEELALLGALLTGLLVPVVTAAQTILSESATLAAMIGACHFAIRSAESSGLLAPIASGLLLGWGGLLRVVPLGAVAPAMVALQLRAPRRYRQLAVAFGVSGLVVVAPMAWNWARSGTTQLTYSAGLHLYNRAVTEGDIVAADAAATRRLLSMLGDDDPRSMEWWHVTTHPAFSTMSEPEVSRLLYEVSIESIRSNPWRFAAGIPPLAWREFVADASEEDVPWGTTRWESPAESSPVLRNTASGLGWRVSQRTSYLALWWPLCALAVLGAIVGYRVAPATFVGAFTWVPLSYLLASASLDEFTARHNIELVPFVVVLAMLAVQAIPRLRPRSPATP
ncbi:MAG: glycosyltransferase family 39 protein [Gemmatimonadaceae bacterium]|nr:glycosyltransferase family 39 protein [Gemmatimonadaceae bacterium]